MQIVDPADQFRSLYRIDIEIHHEALLPAACEYALELEVESTRAGAPGFPGGAIPRLRRFLKAHRSIRPDSLRQRT